MTRRLLLALIAALTLLAPAFAEEGPELPPAPAGFSWKQLEPIDAHFLVPDGWHYRFESDDRTLAYFITQTEIPEGGEFEVGLSLNVMQKMAERTGNRDAARFARDYIGACREQYDAVEAWQFEKAPFKGYGCQFSDEPRPGRKITMTTLTIANTQTDTLYLLWFEAPTDQWDAAWQIGNVLMSGFALDDNY